MTSSCSTKNKDLEAALPPRQVRGESPGAGGKRCCRLPEVKASFSDGGEPAIAASQSLVLIAAPLPGEKP